MADNDAPGGLKLVQDFVNTADLEAPAKDDWADPGAFSEWAASNGLGPVDASDEDVEWAREVREALRRTIEVNNGLDPDPEAARILDEAGERARFAICFDPTCSAKLEARASGIDATIGAVLVQVYAAMENGTWDRLKACRRDSCRWAFYDLARNRSGKWCSMQTCGNREKAKHYRERRVASEN